jgi:hypothetical protein
MKESKNANEEEIKSFVKLNLKDQLREMKKEAYQMLQEIRNIRNARLTYTQTNI